MKTILFYVSNPDSGASIIRPEARNVASLEERGEYFNRLVCLSELFDGDKKDEWAKQSRS